MSVKRRLRKDRADNRLLFVPVFHEAGDGLQQTSTMAWVEKGFAREKTKAVARSKPGAVGRNTAVNGAWERRKGLSPLPEKAPFK